jgi:hypothetical protein
MAAWLELSLASIAAIEFGEMFICTIRAIA